MPTKSKCFENTTDNVRTIINFNYYPTNNVYGSVSVYTKPNQDQPDEMGITGTDSNSVLNMSFNNPAPSMGENRMWTKAKWKIKKDRKGVETLLIPISIKNIKTKKWRTQIVKFNVCKN